VRDRLLSSYPWVFARKSAAPAQMAGTPPAGWEVCYSLPADCLKVLAITTDGGRRSLFGHYEIVGRVLAANAALIYLTYTARVDNTALWDAMFADAFCSLLAGEMGAEVLGEPQLVSMMEQRAAASIQAARAAGLIEEARQLPFAMPEYLDYSGIATGNPAPFWDES
jgi:hypothetical protein